MGRVTDLTYRCHDSRLSARRGRDLGFPGSHAGSCVPGFERVGAGNSAVVVDVPRCGPMLGPCVPNLVPIRGVTGSAHCAVRPLEGPRDHRLGPPTPANLPNRQTEPASRDANSIDRRSRLPVIAHRVPARAVVGNEARPGQFAVAPGVVGLALLDSELNCPVREFARHDAYLNAPRHDVAVISKPPPQQQSRCRSIPMSRPGSDPAGTVS